MSPEELVAGAIKFEVTNAVPVLPVWFLLSLCCPTGYHGDGCCPTMMGKY